MPGGIGDRDDRMVIERHFNVFQLLTQRSHAPIRRSFCAHIAKDQHYTENTTARIQDRRSAIIDGTLRSVPGDEGGVIIQ